MWIKILNQPPKEGTMTAVELQGKKIFVTLNKGKLYCAENRCPHEDIELTLGCLKSGRVVCSLHGFSFDLATGVSSQTDVDDMTTYSIKQENGEIYIQI
ncbi:Rieske (2Fe-2S) protein [Candidatus Thioglobus sp.]|uniref:Rieske (2Fe-2S) protein n=1 Tax=Candidatus Thioglobus sp. TaxID=2026721 RepID=UPI003D102292